MPEKSIFCFHFGGFWEKKDESWIFDGTDEDIVNDELGKMTYDRIVAKYAELGFPESKGFYALDHDKGIDNGLYLIDKESCKYVLQYVELIHPECIDIFTDNEYMDMPPEISRGRLPTAENIDKGWIPNDGLNRILVEVDEHILSEGGLERVEEMFEEEGQEDIWEERAEVEVRKIPTQCSRTIVQEKNHGNPQGYVSEEEIEEEIEEDSEEEGSEEESEEEGDLENVDEEEEGDLENVDCGHGSFTLGKTFADAKEAREIIHSYGVKFGYKLKFLKNEPKRLRVKCVSSSKCPFLFHISSDGDNGGLAVKTAFLEHDCFKQVKVPSASQAYLAAYFQDTIYKNPRFTSKAMQHEVERHLKIKVSEFKCKRARKLILTKLQGSFTEEFAMLRAYIEMVKESNPGSKCELQVSQEGLQNGKHVFRRLFVMFDACKKNWMAGCRPIIGLDGCHLKGVTHGVLLTAVGRDANDGILPIAWAVVNKETKVNWNWFMCWLKQELELHEGAQLTVMSDMQKGLIDAVRSTLPMAEHRWCARHIWANWSKKWKGEELKKRFWICAWSTFEEEFKKNLSRLGDVKKQAAQDLLKYPPQTWCRAYQSNRCCSFTVDNNMSESFNSSILSARHKPVISMLEDLRTVAMTRIRERKHASDRWANDWSPYAMKLFQQAKEAAIGCRVIWNGDAGYEIGEGRDKHIVLVDRNLCTCREWELSGVPCCHAIAAFYYSKVDPETKISYWFHKSTYERCYERPILPVPGMKFFKVDNHLPVEPPPVEKKPGRPKKNRVRASNEPQPANKVSRKGRIQRCSICDETRHKKNHCPSSSFQYKAPKNSQKMVPRRQSKTSTTVTGFGVHLDLNTGQTTINPGMSSARVIVEGDQATSHQTDPMIRFAIPNEREVRQAKRKERIISFNGEGSEVRQVGELPFKAPGLKWKGAPCITTSQLLDEREAKKATRGKKRQKSISSGASTTTN